MAAGDLSGPITTAVADLSGEMKLVIPAALGLGVLTYGTKRAWGFFKSLR